jgi:23S rRNA (cytosine1962-C5)-methyltransferase
LETKLKKVVTLKKNEDRRILNGHLWAFSNEIKTTSGNPVPGDIVELQSNSGKLLGLGFYNPHSLIAVRLLTTGQDEIDFEFFRKRIETARNLREKMYKGTYRLIHGEGDFLPGLIIDKFNDYFSIQTLSLGMDKRLTLICDVLESIFHPSGIVERNETSARLLEGLEQKKSILRGSVEPTIIDEYGIRFTVDLLEGQKTGFFLDQRENRRAFRRFADGAEVLDCFCNDGGFALNAEYGGAVKVTGIDSSNKAVQRAQANSRLNKMSISNFTEMDAFKFLKHSAAEGSRFTLINLDPPSFAKSKKNISEAKQGYREIHTNAIKILKDGGILSTSSCSYNITDETFIDIISTSARRLGRRITVLEWHGAAPDHPVLPAMPETAYLKFGIFFVE